MRSALLIFSTIVTAAAAASLNAACSDDKPPAQSGVVSSSTSSSSSGGIDAGRLDDGGTVSTVDANRPGLCADTPQKGTEVEEWAQPRDAPAAYGGPIAPGTYTLVNMETFVGPQPPEDGGESPVTTKTGKAGRATLIVTADSLSFLEARGPIGMLAGDTRRGVVYTIKDTTLLTDSACPSPGTKGSLTYDAHPSIIYIFPDATHREQYDLVP